MTIMDPSHKDYFGLLNGIQFQSFDNHAAVNGFPNLANGYVGHSNNLWEVDHISIGPSPGSNLSSISSDITPLENTIHEDYDFSDSDLRYINQILMEEDVEGRGCMLQESLKHQALQDAEKSLYEVIEEKYSPELCPYPETYMNPSLSSICLNSEGLDCYLGFPNTYFGGGNGIAGNETTLGDFNLSHGLGDFRLSEAGNVFPSYPTSVSSYSSNGSGNIMDGLSESPISTLQVPDLYDESRSISQFNRGVEEANRFLPDCSKLVVSVDTAGLPKEQVRQEEQCNEVSVNRGQKEQDDKDLSGGYRGRKHTLRDNLDSEEKSSKLAATYDDEPDVPSELFDKVLLCHAGDKNELVAFLRLQMAETKKTQQNEQLKASAGAKGRGKKKGRRKEVIDLRTLLVNCAQAVAADDQRIANELLKQIRQHSSPLGDGNQRLAHYLADGLEARLAGTGSQVYKALTCKKTNTADVLKAYILYLAACPFRRVSNFFSNKTISKRTRNCARIHIIDFGILYGFQWPTFFQRQSMREGGPPKIRITGIDFPQPGFRPAERVEETGRRLENYAQQFGVPFEYHAIAKRWDTIQLEDFDIDKDEVLIVNCIYRMKNLPDETVSVESSRNIVLKLIRKLNPDVFIHGVVNGAYNAPFFVTRFREALFHFSAQYDMLDAVVPRDYDERRLIEKDLLAREALNVVACEGWERVERPETYRQWQVRTMRAGFTQLPLDPELKEKAALNVQSAYHKDFVVDEDSQWLLLGWKGRINFALSTWKPT